MAVQQSRITYNGSGSHTVMAAALVGFALAALHLAKSKERVAAVAGGGLGYDDEEVEIDG